MEADEPDILTSHCEYSHIMFFMDHPYNRRPGLAAAFNIDDKIVNFPKILGIIEIDAMTLFIRAILVVIKFKVGHKYNSYTTVIQALSGLAVIL
ncbi:MAG: hypothetical protein A3A86_07665 [Elusimicrobia bacterium RIFCSPLOWO2_01_FULL_60_11]|nr:MAG: hypothetical protein A3A86_07665 [Elusimicrobia bacterium RIFCSPLOWO2_01_FULL_60_11]